MLKSRQHFWLIMAFLGLLVLNSCGSTPVASTTQTSTTLEVSTATIIPSATAISAQPTISLASNNATTAVTTKSVADSPTSSAGASGCQAQILDNVQHNVKGIEPALLPAAIPVGMTCSQQDKTWLDITFSDASGSKKAMLAVMVPNPPLPQTHTVQSRPLFRGVKADYQVQDSTNPTSLRSLIWQEPGRADFNGTIQISVPYYMFSEGLTENEFWQIANSLQPVKIDPANEPAQFPTSAVEAKGWIIAIENGAITIGDSPNSKQVENLLKITKSTTIVLANQQAGGIADLAVGDLVGFSGIPTANQPGAGRGVSLEVQKLWVLST